MSTTTPIKFWSWFRANGDRLMKTMYSRQEGPRQRAFDELREAFDEVQPGGLVVELGGGPDAAVKQFVVSADGRAERVDLVKDFVAEAPKLDGWEVVAFRARTDFSNMSISIQGEDVSPADVWFEVGDGEEGIELRLFVRGLTEANSNIRGLGASLLAEHALGELDAFALLASLDVQPLGDDAANAGYRPFSELVELFDRAKARKYPPPGSLILGDEWGAVRGTMGDSPVFGLVNLGLRPVMRHPAYDQSLVVRVRYHEVDHQGIPGEKEFEVVGGLCDEIQKALEEGQQSLLATAITGQGQREMTFYTSDADGALERFGAATADMRGREIDAEVRRDTFWGYYRNFIASGEE